MSNTIDIFNSNEHRPIIKITLSFVKLKIIIRKIKEKQLVTCSTAETVLSGNCDERPTSLQMSLLL